MKRQFIFLALTIISLSAIAQNVGIGTTNPTEKLEVNGNVKLSDTLKSPHVIVGTGTATYPLTVKSDNIGFGQISSNGIAVGTTVKNSEAYIQTHTNNDLNFSTNNGSSQMVIKKYSGYVGIGTTNPTEKLEVNGNVSISQQLQILGGNPGNGKILTSNPNGFGSWEMPAQYNTGFSVMFYSNFTIPVSGSINTVIPFIYQATPNNYKFDDGNNFSNTSHGYQAPANGVYQFNAYLGTKGIFTPTGSANGLFCVRILVNGMISGSEYLTTTTSAPMPILYQISGVRKLQAGDVVTIAVFNNTGIPITLNAVSCGFSGVRIY
ncbi:MAG: hypothetical protein JSU03_02760 [Bacteroidetes bacterium]|nr:hypothetical protein [Bacteroidota bacterium]MBS1756180.1 hypothetical protein [Bacteroidota bacterium]